MIWYLLICCLMIYPFMIVHSGDLTGKNTKPLGLVVSCGILWFFMAMRHEAVGVDTQYYCYVFTQFKDIPLSKVFTAVTYATESESWAFDFEPGYRLMNKLLSVFSNAPQAITILNSTLIMVLLYQLIRRESPDYLLSIWLYITLGIYQTQMNVTRNAIAILIVYNGFCYLRQREFGKYLLVCVIASLFHVAALLLIPVYWLVHYVRLDLKKCITLILASCIVGILFPVISPHIQAVLPTKFAKYFDSGNDGLGAVMVGMFNGSLFFVCYCLMHREEHRRVFAECAPGVAMLLINLFFFGLNLGLEDAPRMAALYGPYTLLLIPQMIHIVRSPDRRKLITSLIVIISGLVYFLRMQINNIGGTLPYSFFWQ